MEKLFSKIQQYEDKEYRQLLETIYYTIDTEDYEAFYKILLKAEKNNKTIYIDEDNLKGVMWSSLDFKEDIKMQ